MAPNENCLVLGNSKLMTSLGIEKEVVFKASFVVHHEPKLAVCYSVFSDKFECTLRNGCAVTVSHLPTVTFIKQITVSFLRYNFFV